MKKTSPAVRAEIKEGKNFDKVKITRQDGTSFPFQTAPGRGKMTVQREYATIKEGAITVMSER